MTNLSTCCGAEIGTVRTNGEPYLGCFACNKPQPKGEGWEWFDALFPTKIFIEWGPNGADDHYMEVDRENVKRHIQKAIDEAVEADRKRI